MQRRLESPRRDFRFGLNYFQPSTGCQAERSGGPTPAGSRIPLERGTLNTRMFVRRDLQATQDLIVSCTFSYTFAVILNRGRIAGSVG